MPTTRQITIPNPEDHPVMNVEDAGRAIGLGRAASYEAVRPVDIPSIRIGRSLRVSTAALRRLLQLD